MRFSYAEAMTDPAFYLPLAQAAEEAGYHSMVVPDSIGYPKESDTQYPFNPDGSREFLEGKPFVDPFSLSAAMGAVTRRLRFVTFVIKLPIRHPVLVAKQAASVAALTGNRFSLGVGSSPWPEDYAFTGVPWEGRGRRMDESLEVIRGLTDPHGAYFEYHGQVYDVPAMKMAPVPSEPLPILLGGHGTAALRRAARAGDGWMHGGGDPALLPELLAELRRELENAGRETRGFEIHVISADAYSADGVKRLEDLGVTDAIVGFRWPYSTGPDTEALGTKIDNLRHFADQVIHA